MGFIQHLLEVPESATRFVYVIQGIAVAAAIVILSVCYVHINNTPDGYATMMTILLSGGSLVTAVKGFNKRAETSGVTAETKAVKADTEAVVAGTEAKKQEEKGV